MTPEQYIKLYEKYISGIYTPEEEAELTRFQDDFKMLDSSKTLRSSDADEEVRTSIYNRIQETISSDMPVKRSLPRIVWWAAAAILLILPSLYFLHKKPVIQVAKQVTHRPPAPPAKRAANAPVLTLADGSSIMLDTAGNGVLATTGNTAITKLKNGVLSYNGNGVTATTDPDAMNTISIPRGSQYAVKLPDGTGVWLNAESSLTYPVAFTGKQRKVILRGEAYFEVAGNKQQPFIVHTADADVQVLGTHFNVSAYQNDNYVKTTLIEGAVNVARNGNEVLLAPGQQGLVRPGATRIDIKTVNINQVMAWKAGYFIFRDDDIHEIMKQVSRWYDVEVEYRSEMHDRRFGGTYAKNKDISELLRGLELTGLVHFKIEGRRIIVMT